MATNEKVLLLKRSKTEEIIQGLASTMTRATSVLKDCLGGPIHAEDETIYQICELIASSRMVTLSLQSVFLKENWVKEDLFRVDKEMLEALTSSMTHVTMIKAELALLGINLEEH